MKNKIVLASVVAAAAVLSGCAASTYPGASLGSGATAQLFTPDGRPAGQAMLRGLDSGVEVTVTVQGLSQGPHGFHIHENGVCAPGADPATGQIVAFGAAGGHFDPGMSHKHGQPGSPPTVAHGGDLTNINVLPDGTGSLRYVNPSIAVIPGINSVIGKTLVVHEKADDYMTNPSGNSGGRLLCGVIQAPMGRG